MTLPTIEQLEEMLENATKGPWERAGSIVYALEETGGYRRGVPEMENRVTINVSCPHRVGVDEEISSAALIALAPTLATQRIADAKRIAELEAENERITNQRDHSRRRAYDQQTVIDRLNAKYDALWRTIGGNP